MERLVESLCGLTFLCHRTATMAAELDEAVAAIRTAH
jgi:hypothetical protein